MVLSNKGKDEEYAIEHRATDIEKQYGIQEKVIIIMNQQMKL